jgi:flagellar biosynthesis/type III secretory pathway protein FliH
LAIPAVEMDARPLVSFGDPLFPGDDAAEPMGFDEDGAFGSSEPVEPAAPAIDLEAIQREADELIENGRRGADLLLQAAKSEAQQLLAKAQTDADEMKTKAQAEGTAQGIETGREQAAQDAREAIATLRDLVESARVERRTIVDGAEPEVVKLALAIAERILHREIEAQPDVVVGMVRVGLSRLSGRESVTLRVNPGDLATMREHREALLNGNDVEGLRIVEDQRVDRGGVVIETESGTIDAKIGTQLREARRLFVPDEPVSLPAVDDGLLHSPAQAS